MNWFTTLSRYVTFYYVYLIGFRGVIIVISTAQIISIVSLKASVHWGKLLLVESKVPLKKEKFKNCFKKPTTSMLIIASFEFLCQQAYLAHHMSPVAQFLEELRHDGLIQWQSIGLRSHYHSRLETWMKKNIDTMQLHVQVDLKGRFKVNLRRKKSSYSHMQKINNFSSSLFDFKMFWYRDKQNNPYHINKMLSLLIYMGYECGDM